MAIETTHWVVWTGEDGEQRESGPFYNWIDASHQADNVARKIASAVPRIETRNGVE